jgi:CTP synthase
LNVPTSQANNVTTGRISSVIEKRRGEFLGKTVQVVLILPMKSKISAIIS